MAALMIKKRKHSIPKAMLNTEEVMLRRLISQAVIAPQDAEQLEFTH